MAVSHRIFAQFQSDPCTAYGTGLDQPNPFCWLQPENALIIGTILFAAGATAGTVAVGLARLDWDIRPSVVIAAGIALYAYPVLTQNLVARQQVALIALVVALLIPLTLTVVAIRLEIRSKFG